MARLSIEDFKQRQTATHLPSLALDEQTAERMVRNPLMTGIGGFLGTIFSAITKVFTSIIGGIVGVFQALLGGGKKNIPESFQALYNVLKPMVDDINKANKAVAEANRRFEKNNREAKRALNEATRALENTKIQPELRKQLLDQVRSLAESDGEAPPKTIIDMMHTLGLGLSESITAQEKLNESQQEVLNQQAKLNEAQEGINKSQQLVNQNMADVIGYLSRTKLRVVGATSSYAELGEYGYFNTNGKYAEITTKGNWRGAIIGMHRASNGAVDFSVTNTSGQSRTTQVHIGNGNSSVKLWASYDYHLFFIIPTENTPSLRRL